MSNSQPNPLELAKQGDPEAIATLMNRTLQPKGITAKAILQNRCLEVSLESSSQIPEKQTSSSFVRSGLIRLKPQCIERVKIYGKQTGKDIPSWTTEFDNGSTRWTNLLASMSCYDQPKHRSTESALEQNFSLGRTSKLASDGDLCSDQQS